MENTSNHYGASSSSSSSPTSFDHLFGLKDSSSSSSTLFGSIFPPQSTVVGRGYSQSHQPWKQHSAKSPPEKGSKSSKKAGKKANKYENGEEVVAEPSYLSSSIYYGGQENYSSHQTKKDGLRDKKEASESSPNSACRGNWWQGSLYY